MAVTFDAASQPTGTSPYSWTHTFVNADLIVVVIAQSYMAGEKSATCDGQSMINLGVYDNLSDGYMVRVFALPGTWTGEKTIEVTCGSYSNVYALSFLGTDPANPFVEEFETTLATVEAQSVSGASANDMYLDIIYAYHDAVGFTPAGSQVSRGAWTTTTYISSISTVEGSAVSILQTPDISSEYGHCWYCGVIKAGSFMQDATSDSTADNIYLEGIFIDETRSRSSVDNVGHVHVLEIDDAASGTTVERPVAQVYQPVQDAASSTTIDVVDVQKEGSYCTGEFELPLIKVDCDALIPPLIEGYFVLPCVDVAMTHIHTILVDGEFILPALTWTADAQIGEITVGNFTLPSLSFAAETSPTITGEFALPLVEFDAEGTQGTTSTGTFALPILSVDISAPPRITGTFELPLLEIAATAWSQSITGSFVLPLLSVVGQTRWVSVAADTSTFVMNTDNAAITRYDTFNFNSYCIVDGKAYGANEDGIYLLDGDDDDDQPIVWEIETGVHDFMINAMKKIPDLYLTMRADGAVEVYVTSERAAESLYTLTMSSNTITKNNKVQVGRGHKGRKWQVKVASAAGIDFQLEEIIANVDVLAGKVW